MRQLSKHDVNKLSVAKLQELVPFEITADGEAVLVVHDVNTVASISPRKQSVNRTGFRTMSSEEGHAIKQRLEPKLTELPLSKKKQAAGVSSSCSE